MSFRSSRSAPPVAAPTRIRSASVCSSSGSIRPVQAAISRAHEIVRPPAAVAASSSGCLPSRRIWRTAALASLRPRWFLAASQAALLAYPSASWPSSASNRRSHPLWAARAAGGTLEVGGGGGVEVRPEGPADPQRVRHARESPAGGGQGASRAVCRAHHEPPPPTL